MLTVLALVEVLRVREDFNGVGCDRSTVNNFKDVAHVPLQLELEAEQCALLLRSRQNFQFLKRREDTRRNSNHFAAVQNLI